MPKARLEHRGMRGKFAILNLREEIWAVAVEAPKGRQDSSASWSRRRYIIMFAPVPAALWHNLSDSGENVHPIRTEALEHDQIAAEPIRVTDEGFEVVMRLQPSPLHGVRDVVSSPPAGSEQIHDERRDFCQPMSAALECGSQTTHHLGGIKQGIAGLRHRVS
jgi:hypothetical protein